MRSVVRVHLSPVSKPYGKRGKAHLSPVSKPSPIEVRSLKPSKFIKNPNGGLAQLGERLPCKQEVAGSNPTISTIEIKSKHLMGIKCFDLASKELESAP